MSNISYRDMIKNKRLDTFILEEYVDERDNDSRDTKQ